MVTCLLRELPQGKTQTIHPQTRAVIQRGFPPSSKIWKCVCMPLDRGTNVSFYIQREMFISLGTFHPNPTSVLPVPPAEVDAGAPESKARTNTSSCYTT